MLCGGGRAAGVGDKGHFIQPTVLADVRPDRNVATEEVFGPVLAVQRWSDPGDVIRRANRSIYGLAGGIWSRDTRGAIEMAKQLRTGTVWINDWHLLNPLAPFGGYRQSGTGPRAWAVRAARVHRGQAHPRRPERAAQRALFLRRAPRLTGSP